MRFVLKLSLKQPTEPLQSTPIFILGMPRSGTTLVEQIISSHHQVQGAGSYHLWGVFGSSFCLGDQMLNSYNASKIRKLYSTELAKVSHGKLFVTDKMPQNFLYISLILKVLPEAKIVHVKRDPAATCWSNFKNFFSAKGLGYSYDLNHTVRYFKMYKELMVFWEQLYSDRLYHLDYDKLTVQQEPETKALLANLGLKWDTACLSPHTNKRSVKTASQQQVRKKLYKGSSEAWRKYENQLNGLFAPLYSN